MATTATSGIDVTKIPDSYLDKIASDLAYTLSGHNISDNIEIYTDVSFSVYNKNYLLSIKVTEKETGRWLMRQIEIPMIVMYP